MGFGSTVNLWELWDIVILGLLSFTVLNFSDMGIFYISKCIGNYQHVTIKMYHTPLGLGKVAEKSPVKSRVFYQTGGGGTVPQK